MQQQNKDDKYNNKTSDFLNVKVSIIEECTSYVKL